jgi:hypothetical protein
MNFITRIANNAHTYSQYETVKYETYVKTVSHRKTQKLITDPHNIFWNTITHSPSLIADDCNDKIVITDLPNDTLQVLKEMLNLRNFILTQKSTLVEVTTTEGQNSSFIFLPEMFLLISQFTDLNDHIHILVSDRINMPTYFGNKNSLKRLAENSNYKYDMLSLEEVKKW